MRSEGSCGFGFGASCLRKQYQQQAAPGPRTPNEHLSLQSCILVIRGTQFCLGKPSPLTGEQRAFGDDVRTAKGGVSRPILQDQRIKPNTDRMPMQRESRLFTHL